MTHGNATGPAVITALLVTFAAAPVLAEESAAEQLGLSEADWVVGWSADESIRLYGTELASPQSIPVGGKSLEFVSAVGCRIFDSRAVAGGAFGNGEYWDVSVLNPDLVSQGGAAGGCGMSTDAEAVVVSITTIQGSPVADGYLRAGEGGRPPAATVLAFQAGQGNSVTTTVQLSNDSQMRIQIYGGITDIAGDALGYYRTKLHATVAPDATLTRGRGVIAVKFHDSLDGFYIVTFDRDISECTPVANSATASDGRVASSLNGPSGEVFVYIRGYDSATSENGGFNLVMSC